MKISFPITTLAAVLAVQTTGIGASEKLSDHLYLDVEAGGAIQQDTAIQSGTGGSSGKINFGTGFRTGLALGYNITDSFAAEFETGVIWNPVDKINGDTPSSSSDLLQIPLLADFIYNIPLKCALKPYVGAGAGGVASVANLNTPLASVNGSDFTFAYQGEVGLKYPVGKNIELGLAYKFLGTLDHNWSDNGASFKTDGTMTHAIMATFSWKF